MYNGYIKFSLVTGGGAIPIIGEKIYVKTNGFTVNQDGNGYTSDYTVDTSNFDYVLITDETGSTDTLTVEAPDPDISLDENDMSLPYSVVDVYTNVEGYFPVRILGAQVYANKLSTLPIILTPLISGYENTINGVIVYQIPPNTLITPTEREPERPADTQASPLVAQEVVIPEFITVHLGTPSSSAQNVNVSFPDYIKNVASSEIFPTWPDETLRANILAIISLTLNRVFTEWYPSQGYNFDITNSTQFDQSFVPGRNIFDEISRLVDELFNTYIVREGFINPLFASYCDGRTTTCNGMSQWGSERLGANGFSAIDILKTYYGNDIELVTTNNVSDFTDSYPGFPLSLGSEGPEVEDIRRQLYRISLNYPLIPRINPVLQIYDTDLEEAVRTFQEIFDLTPDGIVGPATWYRISYIYTSIIKLAELGAEGETGGLPIEPPTEELEPGDRGRSVARLQFLLAYISLFYTDIPTVSLDGIYGSDTQQAVIAFQQLFGLPVTGNVNAEVWAKLYDVYNTVLKLITPELGEQGFPGTPLRRFSTGENVRLMQTYLNRIADDYPSIPKITVDGIFGPGTEEAVKAFQRRFFINPTGIINAQTWGQIVQIYNFLTRGGLQS